MHTYLPFKEIISPKITFPSRDGKNLTKVFHKNRTKAVHLSWFCSYSPTTSKRYEKVWKLDPKFFSPSTLLSLPSPCVTPSSTALILPRYTRGLRNLGLWPQPLLPGSSTACQPAIPRHIPDTQADNCKPQPCVCSRVPCFCSRYHHLLRLD